MKGSCRHAANPRVALGVKDWRSASLIVPPRSSRGPEAGRPKRHPKAALYSKRACEELPRERELPKLRIAPCLSPNVAAFAMPGHYNDPAQSRPW